MNAWPTTEEVLATFTASDRLAFDRWLADHDAKVRAEALRDARTDLGEWADELGLTVGDEHDDSTWVDVTLREWLELRADRIERGESS
jgi:hypothetical protein